MAKAKFQRPPFREWLGGRLEAAAKKKLFNAIRDARDEAEQDELRDLVAGIHQRCFALSYVPHKKQALFHAARKAQIRGSFARNQGGKTTMMLIEVLSWGFGENLWDGTPIEKVGKTKWRPGMRFFIGAQDYTNAHNETIIPKMNELLPLKEIGVEFVKMQGRIAHKLIFPEPYAFTIKLISYDQEETKSEGPTWNGGAFDEPPPRGVYVACRRGCMKHAAPLLFVATPLREPWMYDEIYRQIDPKTKLLKSVHLETEEDLALVRWDTPAIVKIGRNDNPYITEEQMQAFEDTLDEEEKATRIHGEFRHLQGVVYKAFTQEKHVLNEQKFYAEHPEWRTYPGFCVCDPHDRKPWAFAWGVVTPRNERVFIDEWPSFDFAKQKTWKWSIAEYADMVRDKERAIWKTVTEASAAGVGEQLEPHVTWRIMDPNFGRTQKAGGGETVEDQMGSCGFYFDTTVDDHQESGHMAVKESLYNDSLFFLGNCTNLIKAMENYTWDDYRGKTDRAVKERPKDKFKDFADLVRYVEKSDLRWMPPGGLGIKNPWGGNGLG